MRLPTIIWMLIAFTVVSHLFFIDSVAVFDEPGYFQGIYNTSNNALNPFVEFSGYKPPMTVWVPALLSTIFGPSRVWGRLWVIFFSCIALAYNYLLADKIFGRRAAIYATVLLSFFPVFFIQGYIVSDAILLTAGFLSLLYYVVTERPLGIMLSASFLVLTKESAIIGVVCIGIYYLRTVKKIPFAVNLGTFGVPILLFIGWLVWNKQVLGWYVWPSNWMKLFIYGNPMRVSLFDIWMDIELVFTQSYIVSISALAFFGTLLAYGITKLKQRIPYRPIALFAALWTIYFFFLNFIGMEIRYFLFLYPFLIMTACHVVFEFFAKHPLIRRLMFGSILLSYALWQGYAVFLSSEYHPERSFDVMFYRNLAYQAQRYVAAHYPDAIVVSDWPTLEIWREPIAQQEGYINKSIICATPTGDHDYFREVFRKGQNEFLYIVSPGAGPFDCDFTNIEKQLITEITTSYPLVFKDTIRVYRLTPSRQGT